MKTLTMAALLALGALHADAKIVMAESRGIRVAEDAVKSNIVFGSQGAMRSKAEEHRQNQEHDSASSEHESSSKQSVSEKS